MVRGKLGEITTGTTIYQAISGAVNPGTQVIYKAKGDFPRTCCAGLCWRWSVKSPMPKWLRIRRICLFPGPM